MSSTFNWEVVVQELYSLRNKATELSTQLQTLRSLVEEVEALRHQIHEVALNVATNSKFEPDLSQEFELFTDSEFSSKFTDEFERHMSWDDREVVSIDVDKSGMSVEMVVDFSDYEATSQAVANLDYIIERMYEDGYRLVKVKSVTDED